MTHKERAFVTAFLGPAKGNATEAARLAGYGKTRASSGELAHRLLKKVEIQRAIVAKREQREALTEFGAAERAEMLQRIARDNVKHNPAVAQRSIDILNKCDGVYSSTLHLKGRLTLEQAIEAAAVKMEDGREREA